MLLVVLVISSVTMVSAVEIKSEIALASEEVIIPRLRLGPRWRNCPSTIGIENNWDTSFDSSIQDAIDNWNTVRTPNGNSLITMQLVTNSAHVEIRTGMLEDGESARCGYEEYINYTYFDDMPSNARMIIINSEMEFTAGVSMGKINVESLILHELGHFLGIAHCHEKNVSTCFSSTCGQNVMQPILPTSISRTTLRSYDTASYISIYS